MDLKKKINLMGIIISFIGVLVSFLLAIEYFGLGTQNIAEGACSTLGGGDSCAKVAESSYSYIPFPFLGNVPIALFGFGFYATVLYLFGTNFKSKVEEEAKNSARIIFALGALAFLVDIGLLIISVFVLETICRLCLITYFITAAILVLSYLLLQAEALDFKKAGSLILGSLGTLSVVFLFNFSVGFTASKLIASPKSNHLATSKDMDKSAIEERIKAYEASANLNIDLTGSASMGKPDAPIVIVKFADFNCGHCMHTSHILQKVLAEYDGMVRVIYKNFPLDGSCNRLVGEPRPGATSCIAAAAAICANKQGKFEAMYHGLYENTEKGVAHTASSVLNLASLNGINTAQLKSCMSSSETQNLLNKEIDSAEKLDIKATPSLFINDKRIESGTPNPEFLKALIERLIKKL
ncbi:vitamin K epoxide reductase family protein [Leptospira ryugenii]|uniref:Vitamin K epoxide reductase family protein n=1 Tax=Leptospira ryugenii TaxID=1917863 RepID=A0A2P2DZ85_9LEPT|nr:thioredoxin domain-containing protein [Leptospira ryugenii]GBF49941.1 vitamin K epoxide reductase family protein [Leptospira ryugenii]